jgi:hypothetical protein
MVEMNGMLQGCLASLVLPVNIRSGIQQSFDHLRIDMSRGEMQRIRRKPAIQ